MSRDEWAWRVAFFFFLGGCFAMLAAGSLVISVMLNIPEFYLLFFFAFAFVAMTLVAGGSLLGN